MKDSNNVCISNLRDMINTFIKKNSIEKLKKKQIQIKSYAISDNWYDAHHCLHAKFIQHKYVVMLILCQILKYQQYKSNVAHI